MSEDQGANTTYEGDIDPEIAALIGGDDSQDTGSAPGFDDLFGGKSAFPTLSHYCASKFAVVGLTNGLAKEVCGDNITVNAICPGIVRTAMWDLLADVWKQPGETVEESYRRHLETLIPQCRDQTPADMGALAVFFATNENVTGQAFNIDGGYELH